VVGFSVHWSENKSSIHPEYTQYCPNVLLGSKPVILPETATLIVPPYWGVPRLSHQFPVEVVVAVTVEVVGAIDVGIIAVVAVVVEVVVVAKVLVTIEVLVVFDEEQDAKTREVTMSQVSAIKIIPFFICPPFYLIFNNI
jgi:hypothetical protein